MNFLLHQNLQQKIFITDLPLCHVLLEDNQHYPWIFLVPRRAEIAKIMDLASDDQLQLLKELDFVQNMMWNEFNPTQLNVAAIGNKTPQLHVHVIARFEHDPAWPQTVWDHPVKTPYDEDLKSSMITRLRFLLSQF